MDTQIFTYCAEKAFLVLFLFHKTNRKKIREITNRLISLDT